MREFESCSKRILCQIPQYYRRIPADIAQPSNFELWQTEAVSDIFWDNLLEDHRNGQFQQSSIWAQTKAFDAWNVSRCLMLKEGDIQGGFQLLWRQSRLGRIGYLSKGPVTFDDDPELLRFSLRSSVLVARKLSLRSLIIQPPDLTCGTSETFAEEGFLREKLMKVIDATLWFDLSGSESDLWARMPGYNRTFIRQAQRRGVTVREGGEAELGLFFDLMLRTCKRQGTRPNPASENALRAVWSSFAARSAIRLTFAEVSGSIIAGLVSLRFGRRLSLWKKGWLDDQRASRPNHLLYFEALKWAQKNGLDFCDFYSVRRDIAEALLAGNELTGEQTASRDRFHLGFGGHPKLLPEPRVYFPSNNLRRIYRVFLNVSRLRWGRKDLRC